MEEKTKQKAGLFLAGALLGGAVGGGVGVGFATYQVQSLRDEMSVVAKIAIMPVTETLIRKVREEGIDRDQATLDVKGAAEQLAANGFIVLDSDEVYAYPSSLEARP